MSIIERVAEMKQESTRNQSTEIRSMMRQALPDGWRLRVRSDSEGRRKAQLLDKSGREDHSESFRKYESVDEMPLDEIAERLDEYLQRKSKADHLRGKAEAERKIRDAAVQAKAVLARAKFLKSLPKGVEVIEEEPHAWPTPDARKILVKVGGLEWEISLRGDELTEALVELKDRYQRVALPVAVALVKRLARK
jgi:hypothetical protein